MKILYVEDQLSQNIERILQLFGPTVGTRILNDDQRSKLIALMNDNYGANNEEIREIINQRGAGVLDVETNFIEALKRIEKDGDKYNLMIVDRQLATDTDEYKWEDVAAIAPGFTNDDFEEYLTREGDYLFMRVLRQSGIARMPMFFFLTAFTDPIIGQDKLRPFMEAGLFNNEQILEKSNADHLQRLCEVIQKTPYLSIRYKNLPYFSKVEALDVNEVALHSLAKLFETHENNKKEDRGLALAGGRGLLEAMVKNLCVTNKLRFTKRCKENLQALAPQPPEYEKAFHVISDDCKSVGMTAHTLCSDYGAEHGNPVVPDDIFYCAFYAIRAFIITF